MKLREIPEREGREKFVSMKGESCDEVIIAIYASWSTHIHVPNPSNSKYL